MRRAKPAVHRARKQTQEEPRARRDRTIEYKDVEEDMTTVIEKPEIPVLNHETGEEEEKR